jgi:uncharacterized protein
MTGRTRADGDLQAQVGEYLHLVVNCSVLFRSGLQLYLQDRPEEFHGRLSQLRAVTAQASERRWQMVSRYCQPGFFMRARADLMAFLDGTDALARQLVHTLQRVAIEQPEPVLDGNSQLNELAEHAKLTIDAMAAAMGAHFRGARNTAALVRAAHDARELAGRTGEEYRSTLFRRDLRLSHKLQLSQFADAMDQLAATALDAVDRTSALGARPLRRLMAHDTGVVATAMSIAVIAIALMLHFTTP